MRVSEEHIDMMLFDYLEGNLSGTEIKQVESQIASDPLIKEELNIWRKSYIQEDYFPTVALESQLLQSPVSFSFTLFLNSILLICLTIISSTNPKDDPFSTSPISYRNLPSLERKIPSNQITFPQRTIEPEYVVGVTYFISPEKTDNYENENIQDFHGTIPELAMLTPELIHYSKKHPNSLEIKKGQDLKMLSRKEIRKKERELRRLKKKSAIDKMAAEFMKGDIPYVVPVNPNNF